MITLSMGKSIREVNGTAVSAPELEPEPIMLDEWRIHPEFHTLDSVLGATFGLIVFQEQVLECLRVTGGYTYGTSALIFDAMRKKDHEKLLSARPDFCQRLSSGGYSDGAITALWDTLVPFADYSFNKAHATAYAQMSYWTAYLKRRYPLEFFCALLSRTSEGKKSSDKKAAQDSEKALYEYIREAIRWGIRVLPPDINSSGLQWTIDSGAIRFGLGAVKGISESTYKALQKIRPITSVEDYLQRSPKALLNAGTFSKLIDSGSFDSIHPDREGLSASSLGLVGQALRHKELGNKSQTTLWGKVYTVSRGVRSSDARRAAETVLLGLPLTQSAIRIKLRRHATRSELEWLMKVLEENPGGSAVVMELPNSRAVELGSMTGEAVQVLKSMSILDLVEE